MIVDICHSLWRPCVVFLLSTILTGLVRLYAKKTRLLMAIPDQRSSHHKPTPGGGGISLVGSLFIAYMLLEIFVDLPQGLLVALFFCGGGAALIGWTDDHFPLGWVPRLSIYFSICIGAVIFLSPISSLPIGSHLLPLGIMGFPLTILGLVWMLNLYNFMDGIDGQSTLTGVFICGSLLLMASWGIIERGPEISICLLLLASLLGFLVWNFPPAKIFLGDVGSCFLGFTFGLLIISSVNHGRIELWTWLILLNHFIVDATATLVLRFLRREKWTAPHRKHLFQRILKFYEKKYKDRNLSEKQVRTRSHRRVNFIFQTGNVFFLFPCSFLAQKSPEKGFFLFLGTSLIYLSLLLWADRADSEYQES